MGWWNTRDELYQAVVEAVTDATTDGRGGIDSQAALANEVKCSTSTLTAEMPNIVAKSKEMYPGYCLEIGKLEQRGRSAIYRYRLVNEQSKAEMNESHRRCAKARTAIRRAVHEIDVSGAGPGARAAMWIVNAAVELLIHGVDRLEQAMMEEAL
jgi:hypothetical protein